MSWIIRNSGSFTSQVQSPKSFYLNEFNDQTLRSFQQVINQCFNSQQGLLPIFIESSGGYVDVCSGFISLMEGAKEKGLQFATVVAGRAFSAGAIVFLFGDDNLRFLGASAKIMLHHCGGVQGGKLPEIKDNVEFYLKEEVKLLEKISRNIKKPKGWLLNQLTKRKWDWGMSAEEAADLNLGSIHTPSFILSVQENLAVM